MRAKYQELLFSIGEIFPQSKLHGKLKKTWFHVWMWMLCSSDFFSPNCIFSRELLSHHVVAPALHSDLYKQTLLFKYLKASCHFRRRKSPNRSQLLLSSQTKSRWRSRRPSDRSHRVYQWGNGGGDVHKAGWKLWHHRRWGMFFRCVPSKTLFPGMSPPVCALWSGPVSTGVLCFH